MTDVSIFIFGTVVTLMCTGAMGMLGYAAWQDGRQDGLKRAESDKKYSDPVVHLGSDPKRENIQLHS
jgi:hypothetical protein